MWLIPLEFEGTEAARLIRADTCAAKLKHLQFLYPETTERARVLDPLREMARQAQSDSIRQRAGPVPSYLGIEGVHPSVCLLHWTCLPLRRVLFFYVHVKLDFLSTCSFGSPTYRVALWLGHESPTTTYIYGEAEPETKRACGDLMQLHGLNVTDSGTHLARDEGREAVKAPGRRPRAGG